jgi:hypothetical protein
MSNSNNLASQRRTLQRKLNHIPRGWGIGVKAQIAQLDHLSGLARRTVFLTAPPSPLRRAVPGRSFNGSNHARASTRNMIAQTATTAMTNNVRRNMHVLRRARDVARARLAAARNALAVTNTPRVRRRIELSRRRARRAQRLYVAARRVYRATKTYR